MRLSRRAGGVELGIADFAVSHETGRTSMLNP
jgi:hypothetical protein